MPIHVTIQCETFIAGRVEKMRSSKQSINGSFNGSSFGHNTNIQSDNNTSAVNINESLPASIFEQLKSEIEEKLTDSTDKEQALEFAENLQSAVENQDTEKANKYIKWLDRLIQGSQALEAIANVVQTFQS